MKKNYPKIGIRPTIDGRQGGIREGLEEKTMNLAKAVKQLIESNLKNGDGSPVECVISNTTIGRVGESAACAEQFEREGVGSTITVTSCWCYGSETMDMNPYYPKAVWGFNGTERPGAVYLAAVLAAHAQKGLPAYGIYGHDVQDLNDNTIPEDVAEKILRFARAAQCRWWRFCVASTSASTTRRSSPRLCSGSRNTASLRKVTTTTRTVRCSPACP